MNTIQHEQCQIFLLSFIARSLLLSYFTLLHLPISLITHVIYIYIFFTLTIQHSQIHTYTYPYKTLFLLSTTNSPLQPSFYIFFILYQLLYSPTIYLLPFQYQQALLPIYRNRTYSHIVYIYTYLPTYCIYKYTTIRYYFL